MSSGPEDLTLEAQGAISVSARGDWRLGRLCLGRSALTFTRPGQPMAVRIDLACVTGLKVERRTFVVCTKRVIRLTYRHGGAVRPRSCWMITAHLGDWESALARRLGPVAGDPLPPGPTHSVPAGLASALAGLRGSAGVVLDYLAQRGYATTGELMALTGAETEDALLLCLREDFRQVEPVLGRPAIRYEGVHFDRGAAVVRRQSWRVAEALARGWLASRVPTDVLVEDGELLVVTSVPTQARGTAPSAAIDPGGRGLMLRDRHGHDRWIALPVAVTGQARCAVSATGTLVIRARLRPGEALTP
jgi:hypothetical protein